MSLKLRIEYLSIIRARYYSSTKKDKTKILNELCRVSGYSRKYAIRILAIKHLERKKRSGRKKVYSSESQDHLKMLWVKMRYICSKKMVEALKTWLPYYEQESLSDAIRVELLSMSASTIDRYLKQYKVTLGRKSRSGTKPGKYLKNTIPIKDFTSSFNKPGHLEADTVAHCGTSLSGRFIWSLTITDIFTGWTNNRAIFGKQSDDVLTAIIRINNELPFDIETFNVDNGTEFLNNNLVTHFSCLSKDEKNQEILTRSRAYRKNDNCHVEQKNWTHVREIFGYDRFDNEDLVKLMDEIYVNYHNLLQNFFIPQFKLLKKERVGSKYKRFYDKPQTPYERLLASGTLTMGQKEKLRRIYVELNPFELQEGLQKKLRAFNKKKNYLKEQFNERLAA